MSVKIVTIDLGTRDYDIYIGKALHGRIHEKMPMEIDGRQFFAVVDENVQSYFESVKISLNAHGAKRVESLVLPSGEGTKSFAQYQYVCEWMLSHRIDRDSVVLAIGGGVIGDLAGFCAASVLRGVGFVQIPTTLLAQVDSSVGGKTGINTDQGKNLVGAFYQPDLVLADIDALATLPQRELLAGYAEIVKYGLLGDANFFEWLEENGRDVCRLDEEAVLYAIEKSVRAKADIVIQDEHEKGRRALLNLGHTFAHALEAAAKYDGRLLHGEAVAIGMVMAFDLSVRLGLCAQEDLQRVEDHLVSAGLPTRASFISPSMNATPESLFELMLGDKKMRGGKINFVLVRQIGDAFTSSDVPQEIVLDVLRDSLSGTDQKSHDILQEKWKSAFSSL
ncbi:MAG: 3-dehydroquinate synthase [Alphaproteobacteria bacterium]